MAHFPVLKTCKLAWVFCGEKTEFGLISKRMDRCLAIETILKT